MRSLLVLLIWFAAACANREEKPKPLVYEGMSGKELEKTLGLPSEKDTLEPIFDGETMERLPVEKWIYEKRTVLLINDTVKNPNVNSNEGG